MCVCLPRRTGFIRRCLFYFKGFLAALSKVHGDVLAPCSCQCVLWKSTKCYLEFVRSCLRSFEGAYISLSVYTVGKNAQKHWMGQWNPSNKANLSAVFELQIPGSSGLPHLNKILKWNSLKMIRCLNDLLSFHEYMSRCQHSSWKAKPTMSWFN